MKKSIILSLLAATLLTLSACAGNPQPSPSDDSTITQLSSNDNTITHYTLPENDADFNRWFYDKHNLKSNIIDGEWFDTLGSSFVSDWYNQFDRERKEGTLDTTYPMLIKFIKDCHIPEDTCRKVMDSIKNFEENYGIPPSIHLTEEEIQVVYSGSVKQINETFASEYCIVVDGNIFTPEWLLNHPISEYKSNGITYEQLKEKFDGEYAHFLVLDGKDDYLEIFESKLQALKEQ